MRVFLVNGGNELELSNGETLIGRSINCQIRFNHPAISRSHARIEVLEEVTVEDLGSANGTYVNGQRIGGKTRLRDHDRIVVGNRELGVRVLAEGESLVDELSTEPIPRPVLEEPHFVTCPSCRGRVPADAVRCPDCGRRRRRVLRSKTQVISIAAPTEANRRRHKRFAADLPVFYTSETLSLEGTARDLSISGVFIASELLDGPGTPCKVTLLPDASPALVFAGVVRRQKVSGGNDEIGMGIEFTALSHDDRMTLTRLLMRSQAEARAARA